MKFMKYQTYLSSTSKDYPKLNITWYGLDNVYLHLSDLMKSARDMMFRLSSNENGSCPLDGCEELWQSAEDLQIHFEEKMDERLEVLIADRDKIVPISRIRLKALEVEDCPTPCHMALNRATSY
jgi:hypothetical protein